MAKVGLQTRTTKNTEGLLHFVTGTEVTGNKRALDAYVQGGEIIDVGGLMDGAVYDYVSVAYPSATQEVYTFKTGGSGGTTVATVTIDYTDATKVNLSTVART